MARADSIINVSITGDAKGLGKAVDSAEGKIAGFGKGSIAKLGGVVAGAFAADAILDFAQTALAESDRVGDALTVLEAQLGSDITKGLDDAAEGFHTLGLSRGDVLELEAAVADMGKALGLSKDNIAKLAPDLVTAAGAIALISDKSPDEVIDLIGKAAGGGAKALKELGIHLTDDAVAQQAMLDTGKTLPGQLTDTEKAAARYKLIMEQLQPKIVAVTEATPDLEASQKDLQAQFETLTGKLGEHLQGPLNDFLQWILSGISGLEQLAALVGPVLDQIDDLAKHAHDALGPLGFLGDALNNIVGLLGDMTRFDVGSIIGRVQGVLGSGGGGGGSSGNGSSSPNPDRKPSVTINVPPTGRSMEDAVIAAVHDYEKRNGKTIL